MTIRTEYIDGILALFGTAGNVLATINVPALYAATEGAQSAPPLTEVHVDPALATKFGNMTGGGGLAAVFNGNPTENFVAGGWYPNAASNAYAGLSFPTPKTITRLVVTGAPDHGFAYTENTNVTLTAFGKSGAAPCGPTDGQVIGSVGPFMDAAGLVKEVTIANPQAWSHVWVNITYDGAVVNGCTDISMYEAV